MAGAPPSGSGPPEGGLDLAVAAVYKKRRGQLTLGPSSLAWTPDEGAGGGGASVALAYADVGAVLGAKGKPFVNVVPRGREPKEGHVFQLDSIDARDLAKDALVGQKRAAEEATKAQGQQQAGGGGGGARGDVTGGGAGGVGAEEAHRRARCLATHPEVRQLYDRVVGGGALDEDEFWASREELVEGGADAAARRQATGPASAFSDDLAGFMKRTGSGDTVNIKLTASLIHEIFVTYPAVQRAFKETVGSGDGQISEKEFWTRYYRYQYFNAGASAQAAQEQTGEAMGGDALMAGVMSKENEAAALAALGEERRAKVQGLGDATVNLAKDPGEALYGAGGGGGGYGIAHGANKDGSEVVVLQAEAQGGAQRGAKGRDSSIPEGARLVHRYNRHAEILLDQLAAKSIAPGGGEKAGPTVVKVEPGADREAMDTDGAEEAPAKRTRMYDAGIDDLEDVEEVSYAPLVIEDQVRYFHRSGVGSAPEQREGQHDSWDSLGEALAGHRDVPLMAPAAALGVLAAMREAVRREKALQGQGKDSEQGEGIDSPLADAREALHADFMASCELLRHFWRFLPSCGATEKGRARMKRLVASLGGVRARAEVQRKLGESALGDKDPHAQAAWALEAAAVVAPMLHADRVFASTADEWAKHPAPSP